MRPQDIKKVLNVTREIARTEKNFHPLFVGPPGIAKSSVVQEWCKENNLPFIDLRVAYLEAPDMIGFPSIEVVDGRQVTKHNVPEFWPTGGEGVLLLEEINRGTTAVLNTLMQLLTDKKIHNYNFPKSWMIVSCQNPETSAYDVATLDPALRNRFQVFNVEYDKKQFVQYMKDQEWDKRLISWVDSGLWQFVLPENIAQNPGNKYISPRTIEAVNHVLKHTDIENQIFMPLLESALGHTYAVQFYAFLSSEKPVLYKDLTESLKSAMKSLEKYSDPKNYRAALLSITVDDIVNDGTIEDDLLGKVLTTIPVDLGTTLLRKLIEKRQDQGMLKRIMSNYPDVKKQYKSAIEG